MKYINKTYSNDLVHGNCKDIYIADYTFVKDDACYDFGWALAFLKDGKKVARKNWNGKAFIYLQDGSTPKFNDLKEHLKEKFKNADVVFQDNIVKINSHIDMKSEDGTIIIGWAPNQVDMIAEDWELVD